MNTTTEAMLPTAIGSGLGFLGFVAVGAVPSLLYGGYMGLTLAAVLFGTPVDVSGLSSVMVFGGMFLGFVAVLSFFLVVGAFLGTLAGAVLSPLVRPFTEHATETVRADR